MTIPFLDNVDLNKNQTLNRVMQKLGTAPGSPVQGQDYYDTTADAPFFRTASSWKNPFARGDHSGTQLASTISDFDTRVRLSRLDQMAAPTASVPLNAQKITGLAAGVAATDAVNKSQLDASAQGFSPKGTADAATVAALAANVYANGTAGLGATLTASANGALIVDGYTTGATNLILVKDEATAANNGLYIVTDAGSAGTPYVLTRASNMDVSAEYKGAYVVVGSTSTTLNGAIFVCNQNAPTVGTTGITFTNINPVASYSGDETSIHLNGTQFEIKTTWAGQTAITTVGTITTGTWSGTAIAIAKGGTGAATAAAGFDALSPVTTLGDTIYGSAASVNSRLAGNITTTKQFLTQTGTGTVSAAPAWGALAAADIPSLPASIITSGTLAIANGGTGASTATAARAALNVAGKYAANIGDGATLAYVVNHALNSKDVVVQLRDNATDTVAYATVVMTNVNNVTVTFAVAPATSAYRVVVQG